MSMISLINEFEHRIHEQTLYMYRVRASDLNLDLDKLAGYKVWIDQDCLIVTKSEDQTFQYYGGFEYVNRANRIEIGEYVVYLRGDEYLEETFEAYDRMKLDAAANC